MIKICLYGLGGQGIVTASEIISIAAWQNKYWCQSFPFFGPERTGAPVKAFVRLDTEKIIIRESFNDPNWIIVRDDKLLNQSSYPVNIKKNSHVVINSKKSTEELQSILKKTIDIKKISLINLDASKLAKELHGDILTNSILLGIFGAWSKFYQEEHLRTAFKEKFAEKSNDLVNLNYQASLIGFKHNIL